MAVTIVLLALSHSLFAQERPEVPRDAVAPATQLAGEIELARLIDLCAERLHMRFEYDASQVRGTVTLRLPGGVNDDELWTLTNRALAARGFTAVRTNDSGVLSITKLSDAAGASLIAEAGTDEQAGFVTTVVRVENQPTKTIVDALKPVLTSNVGIAIALGDSGLLMIADLKPRVEDALALVARMDQPSTSPLVEIVRAKYVSSTQLAASVLAAIAVRDAIATMPLKGKVTASSDGNSLVVVAPPTEREFLLDLIQTFDVPQPVERRSYAPSTFSTSEVARLIEQTARDPAPRGAGDAWQLVIDDLTGTIFVTATLAEHAEIEALLERLEAMPESARRPMRTFAIRNRPVSEILGVVDSLVAAGLLDERSHENDASSRTTPAQRSDRNASNLQSSTNASATESKKSLASPTEESAADTRANASELGLSLTADEPTNTLIAIGPSRQLDALQELIAQLDTRQPQVMLDVLAVSLSDDETLDLGAELQRLEVNGSTIFQLASVFGLSSVSPTSAVTPPPGRGFTGVILDPGSFSVVIRALETLNEGRSLTMPRVLVGNNQEATINSVLQQPFVSTNASDTVATTSFGGTQDAGTTVNVRPQIAAGDHLVLEYSVAISTFVGEAIDATVPPPRQQNTLQSLVTIPDGYTIVVGGLEIVTHSKGESRIPFLGAIPGVGELFKNRSNTATRSRFFVFIRPTVLRHNGFEDLKYISDQNRGNLAIPDAEVPNFQGWPEVEPRVIP